MSSCTHTEIHTSGLFSCFSKAINGKRIAPNEALGVLTSVRIPATKMRIPSSANGGACPRRTRAGRYINIQAEH